MNIADSVRLHAQRTPEAAALIEGRETAGWAELSRRIDAAARGLRDGGVREGDYVVLAMRNRIANVVLALATARLGAAWCNLDWRLRPVERDIMLKLIAPRLLIAERPDATPSATPCLTPEDILASPSHTSSTADDLPMLDVDPERAAALILSSGTTGMPKLLRIGHRAAAWRGEAQTQKAGLAAGMRVLHVLPMTASAAFSTLMGQLTAGATGIFHPPIFSPEELAENVNRLQIDQITLVPTAMRDLLPLAVGPGPLFPRLGALFALGAMFHAEEKHAALARLTPFIFEGYGAAGSGAATSAGPADLLRNPASVGRATASVQVEIVGDDDRLLPPDTVGRIRIRSPGAASGYVGSSGGDQQGEVFRDGYVYPGDLGRLDGDGYLYIEGRSANLIISGGHNINPEEIERVLLTYPQIAEAAVIGRPDPRLGEVPVALVVSPVEIDVARLTGHCRARLQAHKVPVAFRRVEALPKTGNGKIRRAGLAALLDR